MSDIDGLLDAARKKHRRDLYSNSEWQCAKCGKRLRFRPEHVEQTVETGKTPAQTHCGLPLMLTTKAKR